jgi:hypothetical protein
MDTVGGKHSTRTFYAGGTFGVAPFINLLSNSWYQSYGSISKVRIVEDDTYEGLAVEIYVDSDISIGNARVAIDDNYQWSGFTLVDFAPAPSAYNNYYERELDFNNIVWGNFYDIGSSKIICMENSGYVGIGTTNPLTSLSITPSSGGAKITLWDNGSSTDHYGFGTSTDQLNYDVYDTTSSHVFYAGGKNGTGTELMRIKGDGKVGIGTNNPTSTLQVGHTTTTTDTSLHRACRK